MSHKSSKTINCMTCEDEVQVDVTTANVVCSNCTATIVAPPDQPTPKGLVSLTSKGVPRKRRGEGQPYKASGFPRGWHFKKYYEHTDGKVYSRGELVTDTAKISELEYEHHLAREVKNEAN